MKQLIVKYLFIFLIAQPVYSQEKFKLYTGLSHGVSYYWLSNSNLFSESDFNLGGLFNTPHKGSFAVYAIYRFGGYVHPFKNSTSYVLTPYVLRYSALGIGGTYRIFSSEKKISPVFQFNALTELTPRDTYSDFYLDDSMWPTEIDLYDTEDRYVSTDFIGDLYVGCDFKLMENLSLSLGFGGSFRYVRVSHFNGFDVKTFFSLYGNNARLGFNYTFSIKKR